MTYLVACSALDRVILCFLSHKSLIMSLNKGGPIIESQLYGGKPWTILETTHWPNLAIRGKQDNLIEIGLAKDSL